MDIKGKYFTFLAICAQAAALTPSRPAGLKIRVAAPLAAAAQIAYAEPTIELSALDREVINRIYRLVD